jgi:16S rRNA G1207 methylase RsmC
MSNLSTELDGLISNPPVRGGKVCSVSVLLQMVEPDVADKLVSLMNGSIVSSAQLSKTLNTHGYKLNQKVISRHRRRKSGTGCSCP